MKFGKYLKDNLFNIISFFTIYIFIILLFIAFKIDFSLIVSITFLLFTYFIINLLYSYFRKKYFYNNLIFNTEKLDKSYLVLETLNKPNFYEGELLWDILYNINKSMNENVKNYELQVIEFKEYIELWIHEVKIPISSLVLMIHNHKDDLNRRLIEQTKRIEDYVEQVLFYVRSENSEKDYLITENKLSKLINNVAIKNKDYLLESKIDFLVENVNYMVLTDSKWLEFILNQIINNSIKYKENNNSYIKISAYEEKNKITLVIEDNGIGIPSSDVSRVFDKSFTGHNGRIKTKSTGMGLFIAKNLCNKLGHKISIESKVSEYTKVYIEFPKNEYYSVLK